MTTDPTVLSSDATLTFDDEFNSLSLWNGTSGTWDTTAPYVPLNGNGYSLPTNGEQEWYINSNYAPTASVQPWSVSNGVLTLTAAPASAAIQPLIDGYQYTSGVINTSQSFSQTYGFFEMNAELPAGQGMWPAFWLLPESGAWPPEIDVMEVLGNNTTDLYTTVHSSDPTTGAEVNDGIGSTVANMATSFNTFAVDWEPDFITWYFNGMAVFQAATPSDLNQPMYMIANLAAGGAWPGDVNSTTPMPAQMEINYIRAYSALPSFITANAVPVLAANFTLPSDLQDVQLVSTASQVVHGNSLGDTIISNDAGSTIVGGTGNDTIVAGHGADILTGGGGSDTFVYEAIPWNAGQITDFNPATDKLDLSGIFSSIGYTGSNPVADGTLSFVADGHGNTDVLINSAAGQSLITTLDGVSPSSITAQDYVFASSGSSESTTPSAPTTQVVDVTSATYTVPADVINVQLTGTSAQTVTANALGDTITSNNAGSTLIGGSGNDTLIAGQGADTLTGGAGNNTFVFNAMPWNAGHITDFNPATDKIDLTGIFSTIGYTGSNPVADGYLSFVSDGAGDTQVFVNAHTTSDPWPTLITTLNGVSPSSITAADYVFSSTQSSGSGSGSSGGTVASTPTNSTPIDTTAASYTVPSGDLDVVMTGTSAQTVTANSLGDTITANDAASTIIGGSGNDMLIAGHGADTLTGGAGDNTFEFNVLPWNAGQITDFNTATDTLDLSGIFSTIGYTGSNPVADGYLSFVSDGAGDTQVYVNSHSPSDPWPTLITTLDHVSPSSITAADYGFASEPSGGTVASTPTNSTPIDTTAASYTVPSGDLDVVMTGTSAQTVTANSLGDTITANDAASTIIGGSGNDTLIAGHGADMLTGGGGNDTFEFNVLPWNAGHITDFNTATDTLDLSGIFSTIGYTGSNPVADGYLSFVSDGAGDTQVYMNSHSPSDPWPTLITTLDHVSPSSITAADYTYRSSTATVAVSQTPVDTSAASYVAPNDVQNIVLTGTTPQTVTANALGDTITSNDAGSTLIGGAGNDTLIAGHGADMLTGGAGSNSFVFNVLPWNAGQITDFNTATDTLNLSGIFKSIGYTGSNPVADGYLSFASDGAGDTKVYVNSHNPSDPWPTLITTLDHVSPSSITAHDYIFS